MVQRTPQGLTPREGDSASKRSLGLIGTGTMYYSLCPACDRGRWVAKHRLGSMCNGCSLRHSTRPALVGAARAKSQPKQVGELNHRWSGGRRLNNRGYVYLWVHPSDPFRSMCERSGYVLEHRLIMARTIGRPLLGHEQVHHRNGKKDDNRVENLELWIGKHPSGQRVAEWHCPGCRCFEEERES